MVMVLLHKIKVFKLDHHKVSDSLRFSLRLTIDFTSRSFPDIYLAKPLPKFSKGIPEIIPQNMPIRVKNVLTNPLPVDAIK